MQETFELKAEVRTDAGKGASRRLRRSGMVPGIVYGGDREPQMIALEHNELVQHLEHEAFYSHILALDVAGNAESVVLKDLQRHPARPLLMHIDFQRVKADEKLRMQVPLHFLNEAAAPGVKLGGQVSHHLTGVEVSCLPKDLPEFIAVDVGAMGMGDALHLSDLQLPEGISLVALSHGDDALVVTLHAAHAAVEEETPAAGPGAPGGETPTA